MINSDFQTRSVSVSFQIFSVNFTYIPVYAVLTTRVIFTAKTSLDVFSLRQQHVWTYSVLGDRICEMRRVTGTGQQGIKTWDYVCGTSTLGEPSTNQESTPKDHLLSAGPIYRRLLQSAGATKDLFFLRGTSPSRDPHGVREWGVGVPITVCHIRSLPVSY